MRLDVPMKSHLPILVTIGLVGALAAARPSPAQAYVNAGFRHFADHKKYEAYCALVGSRIGPYSAEIARSPHDPEAYRRRARAWGRLPRYNGPWPDGQYQRELDSTVQAERDYKRADALEAGRKLAPPDGGEKTRRSSPDDRRVN